MKILRDLRQKAVTVPVRTLSRRVRVHVRAAVRRARRTRLGRLGCSKGVVRLLLCITALAAVSGAAGVYHVYFDRNDLPDMEGFNRFEFSTVGTIYDAHGQPLKEMANESRRITRYDEIPPIVRDATLAPEDKNFFSHSGLDSPFGASFDYQPFNGHTSFFDDLNQITSTDPFTIGHAGNGRTAHIHGTGVYFNNLLFVQGENNPVHVFSKTGGHFAANPVAH